MVEKVHHPAPITVADRSGIKPDSPANKPGPTPGNANAPVKPLRDIKPDPRRATSPDIERGLHLLRQGKIADGEVQLQNGIDATVERLAGKQNLDYSQVKLATDIILTTYGGRNAKDKAAIVNAVNEYDKRIKVIVGLLHAKTNDEKKQATDVAVSYVTDSRPDRMSNGVRLIFLNGDMSKAGVDPATVKDVIAKIRPDRTHTKADRPRPRPENADAPVRQTENEPPIAFVVAFREIENNRPDNASSFISAGIWRLGERAAGKHDFYHDFAKASSATNKILDSYSGEKKEIKDALVKGVNLHLQMVVGDNFYNANNKRKLNRAMQTAVTYVTDTAAPNAMQPRERLAGLIEIMRNSYGLNEKIIADVKAQCEEKIAPK